MQIKLLPTDEQAASLLETIEAFNAACNYVSQIAHAQNMVSHVCLHKEAYYAIRETFGLSAQMAVRAIGKVSEAYKRDRKTLHTFREHGAMVLDDRILSYKGIDRASIATIAGRILVPFVVGKYGTERLSMMRGQADLIYRNGMFFLLQTVNLPDPPTINPDDFLGIDMGIVNIVTDSDGQRHAGNTVNNVRHRSQRLRSKLQKKGTKSAKRLLKMRRRKEARFARDVNHCISKQLVKKAKDTGRGIAIEELKGIRARITAQKPQRYRLHSWSFSQLRSFIEYKARLAGVPVVAVDPRNTSRTCPECGCIDKKNRPAQSTFSCVSCGFAGHADTIAAENIRRGAINRPYVDGAICAELQTQQQYSLAKAAAG